MNTLINLKQEINYTSKIFPKEYVPKVCSKSSGYLINNSTNFNNINQTQITNSISGQKAQYKISLLIEKKIDYGNFKHLCYCNFKQKIRN